MPALAYTPPVNNQSGARNVWDSAIQAQPAGRRLLTPCSDSGASLTQYPMSNRDIHAAWKYHDGTKHAYWSIRNSPHYLDWANRPPPFKIYPAIEPLLLPRAPTAS